MSKKSVAEVANDADSVNWKEQPDNHDYPAAANYLGLVAPPGEAQTLADRLEKAPIEMFKAKDILRAAQLPRLGADDPHVQIDLNKAVNGEAWSPVLLIRGNIRHGLPAVIADGYHRVCASYVLSENTDIPARVIDVDS
ncbi:MAG: hypothetical protein K0U60_10830 [Actinomycetia bacterium]|nr:hypothetical protein [Actinomycetes bacterium]MCH9802057.1 hypothetical protein [Actinomycetes bacterium]